MVRPVRYFVQTLRETQARRRLEHRLFVHVEVEPTTVCNLRCATCPNRHHTRPSAVMPMALWERILRELASLGYRGTFSPHFYNEPLLDPALEERLKLVRRWLPRSPVLLFTNFTRMTRERFLALEPLVDRIVVTLDAPESRQALDRVLPDLPPAAWHKVEPRWLDDLGVFDRAGAVELPGRTVVPVVRCRLPSDYLVISADGDVHLCYNDFHSRAVMGNVREQSIEEIWFSERFMERRVSCFLGRCTAEICRSCRTNRAA